VLIKQHYRFERGRPEAMKNRSVQILTQNRQTFSVTAAATPVLPSPSAVLFPGI
jgi:hypothetical protein